MKRELTLADIAGYLPHSYKLNLSLTGKYAPQIYGTYKGP